MFNQTEKIYIMKIKKIRKFIVLVCCLWIGISCSSVGMTEIIIIGTDETFLKIKNGEKVLVEDTFNVSPITDFAYSDSVLIDYSDSIYVFQKNEYVTILHRKKLKRRKYLIIHDYGSLFIYSSNDPIELY